MKVAVLHGPGDLRLDESPVPRVGPGDVLIKVAAAGICGTDLHFRHMGPRFSGKPMPLGHEFASVVVEAGPGVTSFKIGDRVAYNSNNSPADMGRGGEWGGFSNYVILRQVDQHVQSLCRVPDHVSFDHTALVEPISVGTHAVNRADPRPGESVTVFGSGPIGLGIMLDSVLTDPEGRLAALCPGYEAKNPAESLPRALVIVDLAAARERGRLPLERGTDLSWQSRDGRMLALLQGLARTAKYPFPASKVTLVDAGPSVTGTLDAGGWDQVERDDDRLYLVVLGKLEKNPQKNRNGTIDVISLAERRVERVDIGRGPMGGFVLEKGLMAIASEGPAGGTSGELRFLREGKLAAMLPVAARPMWLACGTASRFRGLASRSSKSPMVPTARAARGGACHRRLWQRLLAWRSAQPGILTS